MRNNFFAGDLNKVQVVAPDRAFAMAQWFLCDCYHEELMLGVAIALRLRID